MLRGVHSTWSCSCVARWFCAAQRPCSILKDCVGLGFWGLGFSLSAGQLEANLRNPTPEGIECKDGRGDHSSILMNMPPKTGAPPPPQQNLAQQSVTPIITDHTNNY